MAAEAYGSRHKAERRRWVPVIAAGQGWCRELICIEPSRFIAPDTPWDLAHADTADTYRGPAHATCNRAEGGRRAGRNRPGRREPRRWAL